MGETNSNCHEHEISWRRICMCGMSQCSDTKKAFWMTKFCWFANVPFLSRIKRYQYNWLCWNTSVNCPLFNRAKFDVQVSTLASDLEKNKKPRLKTSLACNFTQFIFLCLIENRCKIFVFEIFRCWNLTRKGEFVSTETTLVLQLWLVLVCNPTLFIFLHKKVKSYEMKTKHWSLEPIFTSITH